MRLSCCIIFPIHKSPAGFAEDEILGFEQACRLFKDRKIFLVHPETLNPGELLSWTHRLNSKVEAVAVADAFFSADRSGYSRMLTSLWFYQLFNDFDYMLIHQLDAFVFRDGLDEWMAKGYDYIGAPLVYEECKTKEELTQKALVGNGGLSLRRIATFTRILKQNPVIRSTKRLWRQYLLDNKGKPGRLLLRAALLPLMALGWRNRFRFFVNNYNVHEDYTWCDYVAASVSNFRVAPVEAAAHFSLDGFPKLVASLLNIDCPMGCHAWKRFDETYWRPYIQEALSNANILKIESGKDQ